MAISPQLLAQWAQPRQQPVDTFMSAYQTGQNNRLQKEALQMKREEALRQRHMDWNKQVMDARQLQMDAERHKWDREAAAREAAPPPAYFQDGDRVFEAIPGTPEYDDAVERGLQQVKSLPSAPGQVAPMDFQRLQQVIADPNASPEEKDAARAILGKKTAPPTPAVVVHNAGDKAGDKAAAEAGVKQYQDINAMADESATTINRLNILASALPNTYTGAGGETALTIRGWAKAFGLDVEGVPEGQLAQAVQNQMALRFRSPESGFGMPGAMSEKDIVFLKSLTPSLGKSKEANMMTIWVMTQIEERKQYKAQFARDWMRKNGRNWLGWEFDDEWAKWSKDNPIFNYDPAKGQMSVFPDALDQESFDALPYNSPFMGYKTDIDGNIVKDDKGNPVKELMIKWP